MYRVHEGAPESPVILHVPHGSRALTDAARASILLDDAALEVELDRMTDSYTGEIAARAAAGARVRPWVFENLLSRLVVDPERFPDEREEMAAVGMGAVYTSTSHGEQLRASDARLERELVARHYEPYAAGMAELVSDRLAATGRAVVLDVHSYPSQPLPYELHGAGPRPAICLGTDRFHTPDALLDAARTAFAGLGDIALDSPFAGCYVPLRHYLREPAVRALMLELRRDTYLVEPAGPVTGGLPRLARALAALADAATDPAPSQP